MSWWPFFDLVIRTPRLVLRVYREGDVDTLIEAARSGIHDPAGMPFGRPWTDAPSPQFEQDFYRHYWSSRAEVSPEHWVLTFGAWLGDEGVGVQSLHAESFPTLRSVWSGSWLRRDRQGQGLGKEMRAAVLTLAFDGLGADVATSESFLDNAASIGVSRALGYEENGIGRAAPRGEVAETVKWRLTRERFEKLRADGRYPDVTVEGLDPCLPLLGLDP